MIRVMLVEDSVTSREMLIHAFGWQEDMDLAGVAANGEEAIGMVGRVKPDIILMDINMPIINGYEASKIIMNEHPTPIILMTATWDLDEVKPILQSMNLGVLGVYEKPYGPTHPEYETMIGKIMEALRLMSEIRVVRRTQTGVRPRKVDLPVDAQQASRVVLVGASTGGPPVLHTILKALPSDFPLPILIAQHMNSDFIDSFAQWLDGQCGLKVKQAASGESIRAGMVYIAPKNHHITLNGQQIRLLPSNAKEHYVPSVSRLFASADTRHAGEVLAILLSGMGSDGAAEITQLKRAGALTVAQDEASSVVFGMAHEAVKKDGIRLILSPEGIVDLLLSIYRREKR